MMPDTPKSLHAAASDNLSSPNVSSLFPWNWPLAIRWLFVLGILVSVPFGIRSLRLSSVPLISEPFDVDEYCRVEVPDEENAFTEYRLAAKMYDSVNQTFHTDEAPNFNEVYDEGWEIANESLKMWLESHQEALAVWKRGTQKSRGLYKSPANLRVFEDQNAVSPQRALVQLAMLESSRCLHDGRLEDAWEWAQAAFRCGGHITYRGQIINSLGAFAIHVLSAEGIARWAEQPGLSKERLMDALATIRSDYTLYELQSDVLKSEYVWSCNALRTSDWAFLVACNAGHEPSDISAPLIKPLYWMAGEPELTIRLQRQVLFNQLPEIDKPLHIRRKRVGKTTALFDLDPSIESSKQQLGPVAIEKAINSPIVSHDRLFCDADPIFQRQAARQATLEVLLALQAYRRDQGEFPGSLSQLVPEYLKSIPIDPLSVTGAALCYRRDEVHKATVWSIGLNGADDKGSITGVDDGFVAK